MRRIQCAFLFLMLSVLVTGTSQAASANFSGFADVVYVLSDGVNNSPSPVEGTFDVTAEVDVDVVITDSMTARIDVDLNLTDNTGFGQSDSGRIEQGFFSWTSASKVNVMGGVFNNPLGWEAEDAPDLYQISHGQIYNLWDASTDLNGNNVAGVAVSSPLGPVSVTGAILNDLGAVAEEQSILAMVNFTPENMKGLELEAGFALQDGGVENIIDVNATYEKGVFMVGGELMLASEGIDYAFGVTGGYKINDQFGMTARLDDVSFDVPGVSDVITLTFAASYLLDQNLVVNFELRINNSDFEPGILPGGPVFGGLDCSTLACDGELIQVEAIATF